MLRLAVSRLELSGCNQIRSVARVPAFLNTATIQHYSGLPVKTSILRFPKQNMAAVQARSVSNAEDPVPQVESRAQKLKRAVKEYGGTVIVFHVTMSLASLGICYTAVASGLDVPALITSLGIGGDLLQSKLATGASTFVVAYAVHKVFAPVRISITLACVPWIVRYLRRVGFLKAPQP